MVEGNFGITLKLLHFWTDSDTNFALNYSWDHLSTYPILLSLAKDYLACSASLCAAERTFSLSANVCSSGWGRLAPRTIECCVSSHMWLKAGIKVSGKFAKAQSIVSAYSDFSEKKK